MPIQTLLTIEDAAAELNVDTLAVQRLYARGRLPATVVGDDALRFRASDLEDYVAKGAIGLEMPPVKGPGLGVWFQPIYSQLASQFESAIIQAGQEQVPKDTDVLKVLQSLRFVTSADFLIKPIGAVAQVLSADAPGPSDLVPDQSGKLAKVKRSTRIRYWRTLFAADLLRDAAKQLIGMQGFGAKGGLWALYASPDDYQRITAEAYQRASQRRIVFSKSYVMPDAGRPNESGVRTASFLFPVNNILTPDAKEKLIRLAF